MAGAQRRTTAGIVLTGGSGARLGGTAKARIETGGRTLLDLVLDALDDRPVVVVGEEMPTGRPVRFTRETPPGGGPAAGVLAGLDRLGPEVRTVVVLAVDLPGVTTATVGRLLEAVGEGDGAVLVDATGRRQPLCAAYIVGALRAADPGPAHREGLAVRRLVGGLRLAELPAIGDEAEDVDTPEDLARLRRRL